MVKWPRKSTTNTRISSTPNHSLVPSLATAALEDRIAGTIPAAAAMIGLGDACRTEFVIPNDADFWQSWVVSLL